MIPSMPNWLPRRRHRRRRGVGKAADADGRKRVSSKNFAARDLAALQPGNSGSQSEKHTTGAKPFWDFNVTRLPSSFSMCLPTPPRNHVIIEMHAIIYWPALRMH